MIKLIKLEYQKHKIGKYVTIALVLTAALAIFTLAMTYLGIARDSDSGVVEMAIEGTTVSSLVELLTTVAFLILSSSMLSAFIVDEYKTICLSITALYIGLLLKSTKATIIASFLLIFVTQGSIGSLSLSGNMLSSIVLIVISIFCAFLCVAKIDTKDVVGGK